MLRRLFTFVSVLSLLLCVTTCVIWVRSYWQWDLLSNEWSKAAPETGYHGVRLISDAGVLGAEWDDVSPNPEDLKGIRDAKATRNSDGWNHETWTDVRRWYFHDPASHWLGIPIGHESGHPLMRGFRLGGPSEDVYETNRAWWTPHWLLAAATAILPVVVGYLRLRTIRRDRRVRAGMCVTCGYDLRASLHRCPECGAARTYGRRHAHA
jgi:hypothetical protein